MTKSLSNRGFTLAELIIVVAIIAILTSVAIPVFSGMLERAKESTDLANIRTAYAEAAMEMLDNGSAERRVIIVQQIPGWEPSNQDAKIGSYSIVSRLPDIQAGDIVLVKLDETGTLSLTIEE